MPTFQETGAAWLNAQMASYAGQPCVYRRGFNVVDVTLAKGRSSSSEIRRDLFSDLTVVADPYDFTCATSDLEIDGLPALPQPGDEIDVPIAGDDYTTHVVFPVIGERCFRYGDTTEKRLRIFTVAKNTMTELLVRPVGDSFTVDAILSVPLQSQEVDTPGGDVKVRHRAKAYAMRRQFPEWMTELHREMEITEIHGVNAGPDWSLDLDASRWGPELVVIGLVRTPLLVQGELRRGQV